MCSGDARFIDIPLKKTYSATQPFRRMKVRLKKEIISLGRDDINPRELTGEYISPQELYAMYENNEDVIVLDTRNEYETRVGLFENAVDLQLDTFRDFPQAIEQYLIFMEEDPRFLDIPLKKTYSETQPFRRMKVRL